MKKIHILFLSIIISATVIGQNVEYADISNPNEAKISGVFHFNFDHAFTLDNLTKASDYYTEHFKAEYVKTNDGYSATITILTADQLSRKVLERYFITLGVQKIDIGSGSFLEVRPFLQKFIALPK